MFLLTYRSSKHEAAGMSPAEVCFGRDLRLLVDLLRGNPPEKKRLVGGCIGKRKTKQIHNQVLDWMKIRSERMKI